MANPNLARGLIPVRYKNGGYWSGAASVYHVLASYGTALYIGDPVKTITDESDANGIQTVNAAAAGNTIAGVVVGVVAAGEPVIQVTRDMPVYRAASVAGYVLVADDPDIIFEAQEDGVGGVMTVGAVGRNADIIVAAGSTTTGYSGVMIDSSTLGTGTANLRIVQAVQRADNDPTIAYAKWLVSILEHAALTATGV